MAIKGLSGSKDKLSTLAQKERDKKVQELKDHYLGNGRVLPNDSHSISGLWNDPVTQQNVRAAQGRSLGELETGMVRAFTGINLRGHTAMVQQNAEHTGLIFFTKPDLNLIPENCAMDRHFIELLSDDTMSFQAAIRAYLDPDGHRKSNIMNGAPPYINSDLVDPKSPFISLLTNTCKIMNGWPDPILDTFVSEPGRRQEVWGIADGVYNYYGQFDLTGTFKNIPFDPVRRLFDYWCRWQSNVSMGRMIPKIENIINLRVDYQTRIYRFTLDRSRQFVTRSACTGASHPMVTNIGRIFDYESDRTQVEAPDADMQFKCYGALYDDPVIIMQFNNLVKHYNNDLANETLRSQRYKKLDPAEWKVFDHSAYPLINEDTKEISWYTPIDVYESLDEYFEGKWPEGDGTDNTDRRSFRDRLEDDAKRYGKDVLKDTITPKVKENIKDKLGR